MKNDRLNREIFSVERTEDLDEIDRQYWLKKSGLERIQGVELSRQLLYGKEATQAPLHRVIEITRRS